VDLVSIAAPIFLACAPGVAVVDLLGPSALNEKVRAAPPNVRRLGGEIEACRHCGRGGQEQGVHGGMLMFAVFVASMPSIWRQAKGRE